MILLLRDVPLTEDHIRIKSTRPGGSLSDENKLAIYVDEITNSALVVAMRGRGGAFYFDRRGDLWENPAWWPGEGEIGPPGKPIHWGAINPPRDLRAELDAAGTDLEKIKDVIAGTLDEVDQTKAQINKGEFNDY